MRRAIIIPVVLLAVALAVLPASAQQSTGSIAGLVTDSTGAALPGVTVDARHLETGFTRSTVTDERGAYRLAALPVGNYDLTIALAGFKRIERKGIIVNVAQQVDLPFRLDVASISETVQVTGESPLVQTTSSSVGGVVDVARIENLPLNGRQFANLAATIPGVGLGFHSDPTKSTQYSPQINGGNGRNVNYQIDGGDNNDDTVGGLLQLYPLEAIQEFNFITQRYKAEYGRSNGGVMNIVTKSGTNEYRGSWFTSFRDKSLNSITETEKLNKIAKQDYRRWQFGGSFGGPIIRDKVHFFAAAERTQKDTSQAVSTLGLFPSADGVYPTPSRENLFTVKASASVTPEQYLSVRYGRNTNSQVYGAGTRSVVENWGDSTNTFNSINLNHNWVMGGSKLNEFIFQYADFANHIVARTGAPRETFPNGVVIGYNANTPQTTIQHKYQFRDDFSWHVTGRGGIGHDFKTGFNYMHEPKLYVTFASGSSDYAYTHLTNDKNGTVSDISRNKPGASANLPMNQYAVYVQDDWRLTNRITVNAGLRYDLVTGFKLDQSKIPNFVILQAAGQAGTFNGVPGFEEFGTTPQEDTNNIQPRIGFAWDVRGDGRDVVRAGWGIYYDFGYTNANILFPGLSVQGGSGIIFQISGRTSGIKNADGSFFIVGQPISNVASQNEVNPNGPFYSGQLSGPRVLQPFTYQTSIGWSHELTPATVIDVDYIQLRGHDLGVRWPLNTRVSGGARRYASLGLNPAAPTFNISVGASKFDGLNLGVRRRMEKGIQLNAWYSLSKATGLGGLGVDELTTNLVQDATKPYADAQWGPAARTDARHRISLSAVIQVPWQIYVSPIYTYRSALPMHIWYGYDLNADGASNDIYTTAYQYTGIDASGNPSFKEIGSCTSVNCGRGSALSQFNMRVSKQFTLPRAMTLELQAEVFNLFNSINPAFGTGANSASRYYTGTVASHSVNTVFMKPTAFAGDAGMAEQRVGQIGLRFTF